MLYTMDVYYYGWVSFGNTVGQAHPELLAQAGFLSAPSIWDGSMLLVVPDNYNRTRLFLSSMLKITTTF